jgi:uncharacterized protein (DUF305 family)
MDSTVHGRIVARALSLVAVALLAGGVAACGGGESDGAQRKVAKGTAADRGFLQAMVPHHRSAVEMAEVAQKQAEHPELKRLGATIVGDQNREIAQMERIHQRLFRTKLKPDPEGHMKLGLSAEESGMDHMEGATKLRGANPFDSAFIDEMVPHHQGAIRMARAVLEKTKDPEVRRLADAIVAAQSREIEQMNRWRASWYGAPSPAGGVPPANEKSEPEHMEHSG